MHAYVYFVHNKYFALTFKNNKTFLKRSVKALK